MSKTTAAKPAKVEPQAGAAAAAPAAAAGGAPVLDAGPTMANVTEVADAAAQMSAATGSSLSPEELLAAELDASKVAFNAAAEASAARPLSPVEVLALADKARADAEAMARDIDAAGPLHDDRPAPEFPLVVVLVNTSNTYLTEPVTGAVLPPGGSAPVTLHDEDHAQQVAESVRQLVEDSYLPETAVVVRPA